MAKKSANEKLHTPDDLPKIVDLSEKPAAVARLGGSQMLVAAPLQYHELMAAIPAGRLITVDRLRAHLARAAGADLTCPLTAGIFVNICAQASEERAEGKIAWWRTLKKDGALNEKYPGGIEIQRALLENEGHRVVQRGKRYFVADYQPALFALE